MCIFATAWRIVTLLNGLVFSEHFSDGFDTTSASGFPGGLKDYKDGYDYYSDSDIDDSDDDLSCDEGNSDVSSGRENQQSPKSDNKIQPSSLILDSADCRGTILAPSSSESVKW